MKLTIEIYGGNATILVIFGTFGSYLEVGSN